MQREIPRRWVCRPALILLLSSLVSCASSQTPTTETPLGFMRVNQATNSAGLIDLRNRPRSLQEFKGHYVLLHFWASWCMTCKMEFPALANLAKKLNQEDLLIVGVAVEDKLQDVKNFLAQGQYSFQILIDQAGEVSSKFVVNNLPETVLLGPDGQIHGIIDPNDGTLQEKITGPRRWDSPQVVEYFKKLINSNSTQKVSAPIV